MRRGHERQRDNSPWGDDDIERAFSANQSGESNSHGAVTIAREIRESEMGQA